MKLSKRSPNFEDSRKDCDPKVPWGRNERVMSGEMGKVIPYKEPGKSSTNSWFQPVWNYKSLSQFGIYSSPIPAEHRK